MTKKATIFRKVMDSHLCPYGIKAKFLLEKAGFDIIDHQLKSQQEADECMKKYDVDTTPQIFIEEKHIGGYDELKTYLNKDSSKKNKASYQPVVAIFLTAFLMALALNWQLKQDFNLIKILTSFIALSMCILAIFKLRDLESFSLQFISYDLLAQKYVPYAYIYPFIEALAGILMLGHVLIYLAAPGALFIGGIGAISVFKAVYIDKKDIKCACVGGDSNVPLGFISLTENIMMIFIAIWMLSNL